jgi:hypothetical protein
MSDILGFFSAWQAAVTIKNLIDAGKLKCPKRSIRVVLWVDFPLFISLLYLYFF